MKPLVLLFLLGCCGGCGKDAEKKPANIYGIPFTCEPWGCSADDLAEMFDTIQAIWRQREIDNKGELYT